MLVYRAPELGRMHYIARLLADRYPDLLTFGLSRSQRALNISFEEVKSELRVTDSAVKLVEREVGAEHNDKEDRFATEMRPFEQAARKKVDAALVELELVEGDLKSLALRFAENTKGKFNPAGLFSKLVRFRDSIQRAHQENIAEANRAERAAKSAAETAKRKAAKEASKEHDGGVFEAFKAANSGNASDIVNSLRSRYRAGSQSKLHLS